MIGLAYIIFLNGSLAYIMGQTTFLHCMTCLDVGSDLAYDATKTQYISNYMENIIHLCKKKKMKMILEENVTHWKRTLMLLRVLHPLTNFDAHHYLMQPTHIICSPSSLEMT